MPSRPTGRLSAVTVALALMLASPAALAAPVEFHIPAQPLDDALRAFAAQANIELLYAPEAVRGRAAPPVDGSLEPEAALERLLAGSGLAFERSETGAFVLTGGTRRQEELSLGTVVTTATRTEQRLTDVPAAVSVITSEQIARQHAVEATDLVRQVEGVDVRTTATLGASKTLSIRGVGNTFGGTTSPVLIDGMALESPVTNIHVGHKVLAVDDVEQIEVARGPVSALYGPSALGGVINIVTKRWQGAPGAEVQMGAGSQNARSIGVAAGRAWDGLDLRVSASDYATDGFKADRLYDLKGRDAAVRKYSLNGGWRPSGNQEITFAARNAEIESAWLGGHPNYRLDNDVSTYDLGYRHELGTRAVFKVNYRHLRQEDHALFDQDSWESDGSLALAEEARQSDENDQVDLQADMRLSDRNLLSLGYTYALGSATSNDNVIIYDELDKMSWKSRMEGVSVQDEHHFGDKLTLFVGGRWDEFHWYDNVVNGTRLDNDRSDSVFNPRVSALYQLTSETGIYAAAGSAYVPARTFLRYRASPSWLDNPDLDPERAVSSELGLHHRAAGWLTRVGMFHTDYTDKITTIWIGNKRQYQNLGKVAVDGVEFSAQGNLEGGWQPYINYAYTDSRIAENRADPSLEGNRLQYVAPVKINLGVTYAPAEDYFVGLSGRYVSGYFTNDTNSNRVGDYFVSDLNLGWQPKRGLELTLALNNFLDREYLENQFEYAQGASYWAGLKVAF